ncbi:hypothetical protein AB0K09_14780 [Streptomyces sp. NPDC049577]|uniref:hypothetical protein n=1 Tax=Streptomyces sp. NPDC049577 TaxID=3155153 RepID=UPI00341BFC58
MVFARRRLAAAVVTAVASVTLLGQAPAAVADDHDRGRGLRDLPVMVVSPAPGKITKEHKVTDTYQYDQKASGSSSSDGSSSQPPAPSAPEPGPVTSAKDAVNSTAASATSGLGATADSALK